MLNVFGWLVTAFSCSLLCQLAVIFKPSTHRNNFHDWVTLSWCYCTFYYSVYGLASKNDLSFLLIFKNQERAFQWFLLTFWIFDWPVSVQNQWVCKGFGQSGACVQLGFDRRSPMAAPLCAQSLTGPFLSAISSHLG